jgi:predicted nucleic acid-binding protein
MSRSGYLFDTSFLIDWEAELEAGVAGPASRTFASLPDRAALWLSPVTVAEFLEAADDEAAAARALGGYRLQTIGWAAARRCAAQQARAAQRLGENDAWQAALALGGGLTIVGHDKAFERFPGLAYRDHRKG